MNAHQEALSQQAVADTLRSQLDKLQDAFINDHRHFEDWMALGIGPRSVHGVAPIPPDRPPIPMGPPTKMSARSVGLRHDNELLAKIQAEFADKMAKESQSPPAN